jgi:hypothetical protein
VPVAITATSGGSSTRDADDDTSGRRRQWTAQENSTRRLRVPTRVTDAVTSTTSPA